jgi:transposase
VKRDREVVHWIARLGAVEVRHVMERFGICRSVAYDLVARCKRAGLLERLSLLHQEPALIRATRDGIAFSELGLGLASVTAGSWAHWTACADVALWLERTWGAEALMSVRELVFEERLEERPIASAVLGEYANGAPKLHRPDLVVRSGERPTAVEVELTAKAPRRLEYIVRAWRRCRRVEKTIYVSPTGLASRSVDRAIRRAHAEQRVELVDLMRALER